MVCDPPKSLFKHFDTTCFTEKLNQIAYEYLETIFSRDKYSSRNASNINTPIS